MDGAITANWAYYAATSVFSVNILYTAVTAAVATSLPPTATNHVSDLFEKLRRLRHS